MTGTADRVALDTSVIVSALLGWHEHHPRSREVVERARVESDLVLPAPALVEAYSVMTRLPSPHRIAPATAGMLLRSSFADVRVAALPARAFWPLLAGLAEEGIAGGRAYDAHILAAALHASAAVLLTVNVEDFRALAGDRIEIRSPLET